MSYQVLAPPISLSIYCSNYSPPARPPPNISDITIELEQLHIKGKVSCNHIECTYSKPIIAIDIWIERWAEDKRWCILI